MNEWVSYKVSDLPYQENNAFKMPKENYQQLKIL